MKKFYAVVGNPPFQEDSVGDNESYEPPIYNLFLDETYKVGDRVEMVHPARFLFNAGSTPKAWNRKMLSDPHLKVLSYESDSGKVFPSIQLPGGIAVTYRDETKNFGPIGVYTPFAELNSIIGKVTSGVDFKSMSTIAITRTAYRLTDKLHFEHPEVKGMLSAGHAYDVSTNIFERLPQIFLDAEPDDGNDYIRMYGRFGGNRVHKYVRRDYINSVASLDRFKIVYAEADGAAGTLGKPVPARILGTPIIETPGVGTTESFMTVGSFDTNEEANNALKYVKTRFFRTLVGVLKTTQHITPDKFTYAPLQVFTASSDTDWSKSVADIDRQLYRKYGLDDAEIEFIESHVKGMD